MVHSDRFDPWWWTSLYYSQKYPLFNIQLIPIGPLSRTRSFFFRPSKTVSFRSGLDFFSPPPYRTLTHPNMGLLRSKVLIDRLHDASYAGKFVKFRIAISLFFLSARICWLLYSRPQKKNFVRVKVFFQLCIIIQQRPHYVSQQYRHVSSKRPLGMGISWEKRRCSWANLPL